MFHLQNDDETLEALYSQYKKVNKLSKNNFLLVSSTDFTCQWFRFIILTFSVDSVKGQNNCLIIINVIRSVEAATLECY